MDVCLVGSWAKIPNGEDGLDMAQNVFLNRDNIAPLPENKLYLADFREKHPDVKAALVEGIEHFDDQYFGTGESEAICMDPQQRMLMQGVILALENAGITIEMASEARVAVYTAAWTYDYKDLLPPDQYMATGNSASVMCGRITYFLNSRGAAVGIETACSSSLVAFHLARQAIINGETKLALVCGANHVGSRSFHSLYNSHMVSPNGRLAAFDRSANGFVRAEAFAVAVLCSKQFAEENNLRIHCDCIGSAFNSDGKTPSLTAPNPISQYEVQLEASRNIDPQSVQLVTCHGTGTKLGDQVELSAIKKSFKPDIRVMSPKSSMGHGEGAAGLIGVLQSLYSMQQEIIPNQLHLQLPSEELGAEKSMAFVNEEMSLTRVAISSYGFGGTNACVVIAKPEHQKSTQISIAESKVLFLSAKSHESLNLKIKEYAQFLEHSDSMLEDILYTVNERKTKYDVRAAVFGKNKEEMARKLRNGEFSISNSKEGSFEVEFGEGNEQLWLLRMLYETNETFNSAVDKYCKLAESCGFPEARTALFFPFKLTLTPLTYNVSRLISSMATFELLIKYNTLPTKLSGKGMGQIFCLAAARVISFENAVQLVKAVIAESNITDILANTDFKTSKVPIGVQNLKTAVKKVQPIHVSGELKLAALPNLMAFRVNGVEIKESDPIRKVQKLNCELFVLGFEPALQFRGRIVKTPGYAFLKRKFWPEQVSSEAAADRTLSSQKHNQELSSISVSEVEAAVKNIVKKFLDIDEDDVNLIESGAVDSLTSIEMIEALGSAVQQTMPFDLLEFYPTTRCIVDYLKTLVASAPTPKASVSRKKSINSTSSDVNVIASDFKFAGVDDDKELWDTMLTSKLVTGKISGARKNQCEGDSGLEVGLLKQDISLFDNAFFSVTKDEAEFVDPQHRLLLHCAYNALEKSGLSAIPDADLYLAINSHSEYRAIAEKHLDDLDERLWMGTVHSMAAGRLAALLGIRGRAVLVDTTCSSVATALEMAVNSIREGRQYAVVATSQLIQSSKWLFSLRTLLDHHNTKSFSVDGSGFCRSDGVGVIILKSAELGDSAILRISEAISHHCGAVITPVVSSISQLLEQVGDVSYIEGHGTATIAGDSAESMAYQKLPQGVVMSSVKAQFGHCEAASGLIQLMKVALITKHGIIPSIVHNNLPNEHIRNNEKIRLPFVPEESDIERSAIVSFGITGTKTVVVTERILPSELDVLPNCFLFPISAKTKEGLKKAMLSLAEMIENTNENLFDISTSVQKQKTKFKWRTAIVGSNHLQVVRSLRRRISGDEKTITNNWHIPTSVHAIGCSSFFGNVPEFKAHYTSFCNRLRFEPLSKADSPYHIMAVTYALIKTIINQNITTTFAVSGANSLVVLAAIDAAPSHYLNDLIHAFVNNDVRMMKRIARDVTINIENIELFNLKGEPISTAREAVDAALYEGRNIHRFSEDMLILTPNESYPQTEPLQTIPDYYRFIGEKFVKGGQIDFSNIFGANRKIVNLPEYPFNRKSFWLPIVEKTKGSEQLSKPISPEVYEFELKSEKWKHVRNHVVDSQIVLPGATSMRLVYELLGKQSIGLANIDFLNKITPNETSTVVKLNEDNGLQVLKFGELDAISFTVVDSSKRNLIANENLQSEVCHSDEIYFRFSKSGLTYRNEFQMIKSLRFTTGKGEAQFVEMNNLDILLDGTLQAIVMCYFLENQHDHSPFVPFTIDEVSVFNGEISQKQLHAVLKYDSSDNFVFGDATVYDESGKVVLHITNVIFKRLNGSTAPSIVSRTVDISKIGKAVENEQAKCDSRNMLHFWFEENFGWTDIDDTTGFFDLGLTSIQAVKLRNAIKSNFPDASSTCVFDYPSIQLLSGYLSTLRNPDLNREETIGKIEKESEEEIHPPTRLALSPIGVMAAACRLPGGVTCPAELWELLKIGKNTSSRIPATRIPTRNALISGTKYGNSVEGGNFITQDISQFDPAFFKISKSEAELIDPQQRILLECVQECLENSGVTETSNVGVFVGLMEKEYQDMMESSSILSMLGSMAAVIAGRVNYVFGCHGPSVTVDTACSSSLVALEMAVNALLDNRCQKVIVAGVNLILNERGQGLRANGKMLSQHGMSLSFDSRASGYGRSDGCVVLMLELAKTNFHYMSTIRSVNVNHGGRSVSLTAPNGVAHKMLLTSVINQSPSLSIDYWEAHGTGTPLGDPIELNTLSSILQNIVIGSVKASLGHGEASAGTCGLLKLFLMLTYQYVPTLIHFHVLNKDINVGSVRLPIIGEDADLLSAGISSFGVSGTNAAAIAFNDNNKLKPYTAIHKFYILPISAKNQTSLDQLEKQILSVIPMTDVPINIIASALANGRSHFSIRNALIVSHSGRVISKITGKPHRVAKKDRFRVKLEKRFFDARLLQYEFIKETYTVASLKNSQSFAMKFAVIKFLKSLSECLEVVASDTEELLAAMLAEGSIDWKQFEKSLLELALGSLLNELADRNLNNINSSALKCYQLQPEAMSIGDHMEMLELIVSLYSTGYDLNWGTVYAPVEQFVAMPTYHFNKQSLWFEDQCEIVDHYLIGTIDEETEDTLVLENMISELRHPQFFNGKPLDVGTVMEIAIEALKIRNEMPFSIQNLSTTQITLEKPVWLKTVVKKETSDDVLTVRAFIDDDELFSLSASSYEPENVELPVVDVQIPDKVIYHRDCPNAVIRRHRNLMYVDSRAEPSPFRTANIVLNEIIGFTPNPSDMFLEILGVLPDVYYMVQVDDGALWQFQMLSNEKTVLSNIYVLKDAKGLEIPAVRMHKKSTLLSSQEAHAVAAKTLQMEIRHKVRCALDDVNDSGIDIDESQMSTGFSELGMDSLATVDLLNRLNQIYFPEIELTTSDLFDNPNIIDLSVLIEQLMNEKGIFVPSEPQTPKMALRKRKLSIPAVRAQELAQIEFVENYNSILNENSQNVSEKKSVEKEVEVPAADVDSVDRSDIRRKISTAVLDLATETLTVEDLKAKGFAELGMDSLSIVDFVNRLNEKYFPGEDITASDVFDYPTVDELTDHITRKKSICLGTEPVLSNADVNDEIATTITEAIKDNKDPELLNQAYILVQESTSQFAPTLIFSSNGTSYQLADPTNGNVILLLNPDGGQEKELKERLLLENKILIQLDNVDNSVETLYMTLLNLMKAFSKNKMKCHIAVSQRFSLGNSIARAFMKTIASEKFPLISFEWDQRVQQVSLVRSDALINGCWLITGGLSGIGLEIGRFLANNGADNVILISRRQPSQQLLDEVKSWKAKIYTIATDISDKNTLISKLSKLNVSITGIIHSAGVLKDAKLERQTKESFHQVFKPKADGFTVLEEIENHFGYHIEHFVIMSSFTAACGNEGQLNYGVANAYLEHQVQRRRLNGQSGCAIQWGNWIDTGMATSAHVRKFLTDLGFLGQHNEDALKYLKACIEMKPELIIVANIDWKVILKNRQDLPRDFIKDGISPCENVIAKRTESETSPSLSCDPELAEEVFINAAVEDEEEVLELIKDKISSMLKCAPSKLKSNRNIMDMGLDSQLLTEFLNYTNATFKTKLNLSDAYNYSTLEKLASHIWQKLYHVGCQEEDTREEQVVEVKKSSDFCQFFGVNVFLNEKNELEKAKREAIVSLEAGRALPATGKFAIPIVGTSIADVVNKIKTSTPQLIKTCQNASKSVLMLTGQGSQYPMMGRQLVENYEVFRTTLHTCLSKCDEYLKGEIRLWDILFNADNYKQLQLTKHMQPIMFCFGYATAQLWLSLGVVPDYYLGHSVGELVAGVLAGIMSIEDGLRLIVERGKAMENIAGLGALLAVQKEVADDVLRKFRVCVATINSPKQVVFAGTKSELDKALAFVKGQGKQGTYVNQQYPFHSNLIHESHLSDLRQCLEEIKFQQGTTPLISNITGQIINTFSESYIIKHTVSAVKFVSCVETLINEGVTVWIDAGPAAVLATFVKRIIPPAELSKHRIVQTCKEKESDVEALIQASLELEQSGVSVNWSKIYGCQDEEDTFLVEFPVTQKQTIEGDEFEILEGHRLNGRIIVAGAYQMFKMDQLIKSRSRGLDLILKNVKFVKPWYIEDSKEFEIRWNSDMTTEVVVNSVVVCSAKVEINEGKVHEEKLGPDEKQFDVHEFYEALYRNGLQYEAGFRRMNTAKRSALKCFARLKQSPFAWPLMDAAMHSITASVVVRRSDCYFLPVAMGAVCISPESSFKRLNLHAQTVITSETNKFIQVNVLLFAGDDVIFEVRNMTIVVLKLVPAVTPTPTPNIAELTDAANDRKTDIQIVGFDVTLPFNQISSNSESWQFLKLNKVKQTLQTRHADAENNRVSLLDIDARFWDPEYFGIRPSEAQFLDPQQRLLLTSVAKLLDSTHFPSLPSNTGVFIGCSTYEFSHIVYAHGYKDPRAEWGGGTSNSALAGRIAHWLKLKGPVATVDTACSSSFYALSLACDALQSGKCDYAIVGAVNLVLHEMTTDVLQNSRMTVHDFCKAFDEDANGYKRSEAVCSILLSKFHKSKSIASIASWATGHNGNSSSLFTPNGKSQLEVMQKATENIHRISDVEMHCTGTKLGDPIEANAVSKLVSSGCSIYSIKSNVGHSEGASGLVSLCSLLMSLHASYKPAQLHLKCSNQVIRESKMRCRFIGEEVPGEEHSAFVLNNFGFTGSNCSLVVRPNPTPEGTFLSEETSNVYYPMILSAHTMESLRKYIETFEEFIQLSDCSLEDIQNGLLRKRVNIHRHFIIYNYKRQKIFNYKNGVISPEDERLHLLLKQCDVFVKEGKILMERKSINRHRELPPIVFMKNLHWKLDPYHDEVQRDFKVTLKDIFYEKILLEIPMTRRPVIRNVVSLGTFGNFRQVEMKDVTTFSDGIIVFHPAENTIDNFLKLTELWSLLDPSQQVLVLVCCFTNSTSHTEWTGTLRSLAAEKLIPYKFVSIEDMSDLDYDCNKQDVFECAFNLNGKRLVERLRKVTPTSKNLVPMENVLISGGTGGIGNAILEKLKPRNRVLITRREKQTNQNNGSTVIHSDISKFKSNLKFDYVFHLAGIVNNVYHNKMNRNHMDEMVAVKLEGAKNLAECCSKSANFVFSSSVACILGSFGQSNYTFSNGLVTSLLEKSSLKSEIIHWGPWKEVGMLARPECREINKQIESNGWKPLSTDDALSVFFTEKLPSKRQIVVFDGDWETIVSRQPHLHPFLSEIVESKLDEPKKEIGADFESIFSSVVGINDMRNKTNMPFMDLGIDSLCMENLRHTLNVELGLELTVSEMFENATYQKMKNYVESLAPKLIRLSTNSNSTPSSNFVDDDNRVAVIGWSAEFSGAENIEVFWENLLNGVVSTRNDDGDLLKSAFGFDNKFFNLTDEDAKLLDPQVRKFIQHAYLALENSGYVKQRSSLKCAVFAGAEPSDYGNSQDQDDAMRKLFVMNMNNYLATYASYCLDLKGEAVSVYSACSTILVAVENAVKSLQAGSIDIALVGAASISDGSKNLNGLRDTKKSIFAKSGKCRPFDRHSEGIVRGSGVGCLVLKKYSTAVADGDNVHFVIRDVALCNDGNSRASFMAPNPAGQLKCMTDVLSRLSEEDKNRIEYVECHATGTTLGDTIEMGSLQTAYSFKSKLRIGSCKANIGHAYAASGLAALIKCAKMLQTGTTPPQVNFSEFRNDFGKFFVVDTTKEEINKDAYIALDSFGIGGTNVHMVIECPSIVNVKIADNPDHVILPLSAASEKSLNKLQKTISDYLLKTGKNSDLGKIGSTLWKHRERMNHRTFIVATENRKIFNGVRSVLRCEKPRICLFFAPQGLQYSNILPDNFAADNIFSKTIEGLCGIAERSGLLGMKSILYPTNPDDSRINETQNVQVALFIQCFAIFKALEQFLEPVMLVGHSVGEYVAAAVAGVLGIEEVIKLLITRSKLVDRTEKARMLMVWDYHDLLPLEVTVSAIVDSTTKCVVGPVEVIDKFEKTLKKNGTKYRDVKTTHGFHSPMLNPILLDFEKTCRAISPKASSIPMISSITGRVIDKFDASYCTNHLTNPVNLDLVVDCLISSGIDVVVEIGPTGVLSNLLAQRNSEIVVIPTCGSKKKPESSLANCLGRLWNHGVDVGENVKLCGIDGSLPGYQFDENTFKKNYNQNIVPPGTPSSFNMYVDSWITIKPSITPSHTDFFVFDATRKSWPHQFFSTIVFPVDQVEDLNENFFRIENFLKKNAKCDCIIFTATVDHPSVHLVLGIIRCFQLQTRTRLIYVENFDGIPIPEIVSKAAQSDGSYLRFATTHVFRRDFLPLSNKRTHVNHGGAAILFGANGFIGSEIASYLESRNIPVIRVSKNSYNLCDITNQEDVENFFESLETTRLSLVINCAGQETSHKIHKTFDEQNSVLSVKTFGNWHILESLENHRIHVEKFVTISSLSSIIPLLGNEDYASANCFVEALTRKKYNFVKNTLSLSLPPIQGSRMYENSSSSTKEILQTISMNRKELHDVIESSLFTDIQGAVFVSPQNPNLLASKSLDYHRTDENGNKVETVQDPLDFEACVKNIWNETLGVSLEIESSSNFFSLGGDSLSALQVVWQVQKQTGKTVQVNDLFDNPTLQMFSDCIRKADVETVSNSVQTIDYDSIPLTHSQSQMFMLRQIDETSNYNVIFGIRINHQGSQFRWDLLRFSILSLIAYQTSYRTVFNNPAPSESAKPHQKVCSLTESFYNLNEHCDLREAVSHEQTHQFDIGKTTPLRVRTARTSDNSHIHIVFNQHHILTDGWSMTVLADTIQSLYIAYETNCEFPAKPIQTIANVAEKEEHETEKLSNLLSEALDYYKDGDHTSIPTDSQVTGVQDHKRFTKSINQRVWKKLLDLSKLHETTVYNAVLTVFSECVASFAGQSEIMIAFANSGRNSYNSNLIGYFMNNVLFKVSLPQRDGSFEESLKVVSESLEASRRFSTVPFYKIVERNRKLNDIFVYFNFRQKLDYPTVSISGAECEINHLSLNNAFDFSFTIDETPGGSMISIDYNGANYLESTILLFSEVFLSKLNKMSSNGKCQLVSRSDYASNFVQRDLLFEWESSRMPALQLESETVSFSELASRVKRTAGSIQKQFILSRASPSREDDLIGVSSSFSPCAILACSLIGLPYAPIDSIWPQKRKDYVKTRTRMMFYDDKTIAVQKWRLFSCRTQFGGAYTIFTSGSTGVPKGVYMAEQSVSSFVASATKQCLFRKGLHVLDSVKQVFDVSVSNIFGSLWNHGVLISPESSKAMTDKLPMCQYAFLPAAVFNGLTFGTTNRLASLETLTVGGETVSDATLETLFEVNPKLRVIQIYGPTETCVWSMTNKCKPSFKNVGSCLGKPMENETCSIGNKYIRGELNIEGISLARGYLSMDPTGIPFSTTYNTGDIVDVKSRHVRYIGRADNQVKWKGLRIDLNELQTEYSACLGISQITLLYANQLLIAFLVQESPNFSHAELLHKLKTSAHIPDHFVQIDKMPLNSSGKVDKKMLLQAFERVRKSYKREIVTMENSLEEKVNKAVSETVGQKTKLSDKFTNVGGNSLSAIQLAHRLTEELKFEVKAHDILQSTNLRELSSNLAKNSLKPASTIPNVITKLREVSNAKFNIYLVHAIGGTIYPYYSFLQIFPKNISLYGIEFDLKYPSGDLRELSHFYANEIAAHAGQKQIFVMGHSMGGIMSREIVAELKIWGYDIPFVILFDSWVLRTNELDIENIKKFITYVFSGLPDSEHRIDRAIKLAQLLREYKTSISDTKLYLFKSKHLGDAAFKKAVRTDLNEELSRSMTCNGFDELSLQPIETFLIDGDHESCLKLENLKKYKDLILAPFQPYLQQ